jgi:hypothetical protein
MDLRPWFTEDRSTVDALYDSSRLNAAPELHERGAALK